MKLWLAVQYCYLLHFVVLYKERQKKASSLDKMLSVYTVMYNVSNTLLPVLTSNNMQRWLHYLCIDVSTFEG